MNVRRSSVPEKIPALYGAVRSLSLSGGYELGSSWARAQLAFISGSPLAVMDISRLISDVESFQTITQSALPCRVVESRQVLCPACLTLCPSGSFRRRGASSPDPVSHRKAESDQFPPS